MVCFQGVEGGKTICLVPDAGLLFRDYGGVCPEEFRLRAP